MDISPALLSNQPGEVPGTPYVILEVKGQDEHELEHGTKKLGPQKKSEVN
jgi:hypothetical protein